MFQPITLQVSVWVWLKSPGSAVAT